jgi:hypothetical protein
MSSGFVQKPTVLCICGSLNQTTMMHQIAQHLSGADIYYTPYYSDGFLDILAGQGILDFTVLGGQFRQNTEEYLRRHNLPLDYRGNARHYDLVLTCSDLIVPANIRNTRLMLVQEGMTDPENLMYYLVKWLRLPRYLASTATTGLSDAYDIFCVASEGYKDLFVRKGVNPAKIRVTGIPNFDNCALYRNNDFPHKDFVLVATSDSRETFKFENRRKFIAKALEIAVGQQLIFKLHPNEEHARAIAEIRQWAPDALVYTDGNIHQMIANCTTLITRFSSVVYVGIALGKQVYSDFDIEELRRMTPLQNGGSSAAAIADQAALLLMRPLFTRPSNAPKYAKMQAGLPAPGMYRSLFRKNRTL